MNKLKRLAKKHIKLMDLINYLAENNKKLDNSYLLELSQEKEEILYTEILELQYQKDIKKKWREYKKCKKSLK